MRQNIEADCRLREADLLKICTTLKDETAPEIIQPLYQIISLWVNFNNKIPLTVANIIFELTNRLIHDKKEAYLNGGLANAAFVALKSIANLEDITFNSQLVPCTRQLFKVTDLGRTVDQLFVIALLTRIARFDQQFLGKIVREDFVREDGIMPIVNQQAVVVVIVNSQGKNSPLLSEILKDECFSQDLKNQIIREQDT
ncbi:MAG: hypothetical protein F6K58_08600 [Symploca sp. SIO2E9]|nr:hypothetical protein [Symploca sp. SIO2E9]